MKLTENQARVLETLGGELSSLYFGERAPVSVFIALFEQHSDTLPAIDYLLRTEFSSRSLQHRAQYELRDGLKYSLQYFFESNDEKVIPLLDRLLDEVSALKLVLFPYGLIRNAFQSRYLERFRSDAIAISLDQTQNRDVMTGYNLYYTYPSLEKFEGYDREFATTFLSNVLDYWEVGYKMAAAQVLATLFQDQRAKVLNYYHLKLHKFDSLFFQSEDCLPLIKSEIEHLSTSRLNPGKDLEPFEDHLKRLREQCKFSTISDYLAGKWQGSSWEHLMVVLENDWQFTLRRSPYAELTYVDIPGYERSRDNVVATDEEQEQWTHRVLSQSDRGQYGCSWVIHFNIRGEILLQDFLVSLKAKGVREWSETRAALP